MMHRNFARIGARIATLLLVLGMMATLASAEVYELRTYHTNEGKLDALKARFRDHTIRIFNRHGMVSVGYFVPEDMPDTLIYILKHPNRKVAEQHWAEFQADPEWQEKKAESEVNGVLVQKVDRVWLDPTAFSALK